MAILLNFIAVIIWTQDLLCRTKLIHKSADSAQTGSAATL